MRARWMAMGLLAGLACFALGLGAARFLGEAVTMGETPKSPAPPPPVEPRIVLDPGSLTLLPDASLHLDLPADFDAGRR